LRCRPETGRTHQIRVHLAAIGLPIVGDPLYGNGEATLAPLLARQALHAARLALTHPVTREPLVLEAPLPADLLALLAKLEILKPTGEFERDENRGRTARPSRTTRG